MAAGNEPPNHWPYAHDDVFLVNAHASYEGDILANDVDVDGDELRVGELPSEFVMVSDTVAALGDVYWNGACRPYTISDGFSTISTACLYVSYVPTEVAASVKEGEPFYLPQYFSNPALSRFSSAYGGHGTVDATSYWPPSAYCGADSFSLVFEPENGRLEVPVTVDVWRKSPLQTPHLAYGETAAVDMAFDGPAREVQTVQINTYGFDGECDPIPYAGADFVTVSADRHTLSISPPPVREKYGIEYTARDATGCTSFGTIDVYVDGP